MNNDVIQTTELQYCHATLDSWGYISIQNGAGKRVFHRGNTIDMFPNAITFSSLNAAKATLEKPDDDLSFIMEFSIGCERMLFPDDHIELAENA